MMLKRYVFDTNALVSAVLLSNSKPALALAYALKTGILLTSPEAFTELNSILRKTKFDSYASLPNRISFLSRFFDAAHIIRPRQVITVCRDPKDNLFLALALDGQADFLITGDQDLLVLNPFHAIPILTPAVFLKSLA